MTIFQKLQICDYALALLREAKQKVVISKSSRGKKGQKAKPPKRKNFAKGLNLQKLCEQKFSHMRGVRVCRLLYQCEHQGWRNLSIAQQKRSFQLPDACKVALGQSTKVRGWRSLGSDGMQEAIESKGFVNRWAVPGAILQDGWWRVAPKS